MGLGGVRRRGARRPDRGDLRAGGVGSNAVQGASLAGAKNVIVVDPVEFKREMAAVFGATHSFATAKQAHEFVVDEDTEHAAFLA